MAYLLLPFSSPPLQGDEAFHQHSVRQLYSEKLGQVKVGKHMILLEIKAWITTSGCISYAALCKYAKAERPDWMPVIRKKTISISKLLQRSRRRTKKKAPQ